MALPILSTKLNVPSLRGKIVGRQRLVAQLNVHLDRKLTLIAAPAGFGKTTLTLEWLKQVARPVAWYAIDSADNDPTQFLTYLIHALQRVYPKVGSS